MDELRLLRHFEAVYRLSSFSAAAEELRLTHSAVTKSIKTLEANWGTRLFHRTTRSVVATEAAKKLYPQAVELLALVSNIRNSVTTDASELTILCGSGAIEAFIHPAILEFARRYPKTRINVASLEANLAARELQQRRAHILIYHETSFAVMPHTDDMHIVRVIDEPYSIAHRIGAPVGSRSHSLEELLLRYDWVLAVSRSFEGFLPDKVRHLVEGEGAPRYRIMNQTACIELVKQSDLLTGLPKSMADRLVQAGELAAIPLPGDFRFTIAAAALDDPAREPALDHFVECMQAAHADKLRGYPSDRA